MELDRIEALLAKYDEGQTTLAEEKFLQEYFTSEEIPSHLAEYRVLFNYTIREKNKAYSRNVSLKDRRRRFAFAGIAASVILAVGIFTTLNVGQQDFETHDLGTIEDPEEAYYKAKEALQMVSSVLNTGKEELVYMEEFDKAKNRYIKE